MGITDVRREAGRMSFGATAGSEYSGPLGDGEGRRLAPSARVRRTMGRGREVTLPLIPSTPSPPLLPDMVMGRDVGRLGVEGSGHLRIERRDQSKLVKKAAALQALQAQQHRGSGGGLGGAGGVSSSLAFTPLAGLELANPAAGAERARKAAAADGYFSSTGTFSQIRRI